MSDTASMANQYEVAPGAPAPVDGIFELLNVLGTTTGTHVVRRAGEVLPAAPIGWTWQRMTIGGDDGAEILRLLQRILTSPIR